ncbi:hypothetical protein [Dokdonia sp. Hel_I_53]|uniref:hypothetical protein n=1 Tax=Dokdonia sp. Hel_I_53 TaxID=1566287 RepID=UPI0011A89581|nr:hypothetical protein [Dokdonia sp. Hel_I_53]
MKYIYTLLLASAFILTSCSNDDDNFDFDTIGQTFEFTTTFTQANDYTTRFSFDQLIFDSDVVLVYKLEEVDNGLDVWEPLPTAYYFFTNDSTGAIEGFLNYRFNFTTGDVDVIMNSDAPDLAGAEFTNNQTFRIVVVPSDFASTTDVDLLNFNEVATALNLKF